MNHQRSRRTVLRLLATAGVSGGSAAFASVAGGQCDPEADHLAWVTASLERMLSLKPGMTREQLLRVFTTEGGLSTALQRTFVSRDCRYFKVDVSFRHPPDANAGALEELDDDMITNISRPFLQFTIAD